MAGPLLCRSLIRSNHGAVIGAPLAPRVPSVAAPTPRVLPVVTSVTMEKPAMQIADAVAMIGMAAAGNTTASEGAGACQCTCGKRGTTENQGDRKSNYGLT